MPCLDLLAQSLIKIGEGRVFDDLFRMDDTRLWDIVPGLHRNGLWRVGEQGGDCGGGTPHQLHPGQFLIIMAKRAPQHLKQIATKRGVQIGDVACVELCHGYHRNRLIGPAMSSLNAFDDGLFLWREEVDTRLAGSLPGSGQHVPLQPDIGEGRQRLAGQVWALTVGPRVIE
ncbi:hypothetical protein KSC_108110 [Ktedonobacter sp. SOSP1-52]|nr:hypothetical protein KSC_108110 [Ktedonobacter sp. SOSP1-52]